MLRSTPLTAKPTKEELLRTTVIAGLVTLLVNVAAPWVLHWINPAGPKSSIVEARGVATRKLPDELMEQFKKAPNFVSAVYNSFPTNNMQFLPVPGLPRAKQCLGQTLVDTGIIDDQCGEAFGLWATQTASAISVAIKQVQAQNPPPANKETAIANFSEIETNALALAKTLATVNEIPKTKNGEFGLTVVLLNNGDGDDVVFPAARISCKACGGEDIPAVVEDRYQTLRAHSFLPVRVSINLAKAAKDALKSLKANVEASPNLQIRVCLYLASKQPVCKDDAEIR